jgi:hypothetical protein
MLTSRTFLLAVTLLVSCQTIAAPVRWTFERVDAGGPDLWGSFIYDDDTLTVSDVDVRTGPSVDSFDPLDDFGVLRDAGAVYRAAASVSPIEPENGFNQLFSVVLIGSPVADPMLTSFLWLGYFTTPLGDSCEGLPLDCDTDPDAYLTSLIDAEVTDEWACPLGVNVLSCNASVDVYPTGFASHRLNVGGGARFQVTGTPVPVPGAMWLLGGALLPLVPLARRTARDGVNGSGVRATC